MSWLTWLEGRLEALGELSELQRGNARIRGRGVCTSCRGIRQLQAGRLRLQAPHFMIRAALPAVSVAVGGVSDFPGFQVKLRLWNG